MDVNQLKSALRSGLVTINFTKTNGDRRRMVATLRADLIPAARGSSTHSNPDLLVVFDVENHGWRSMKIDSIHDWVPGATPPEVQAPAPVIENIGWQPNPS